MNAKAPKSAASASKNTCSDLVRELAVLLDETGLNEIEVEQNGMRVRVSRGGSASVSFAPDPGAPVKTLPPTAPTVSAAPHPGTVNSPMVGTVFIGPQPGAAPFIKVGDEVKEGQTILIVEAMKTMNQIAAPRAGKVLEIFVRDAQPVEFGEALLVIG